MQSLHIQRLYAGGLITNYYCSASCKHCLYGSSPSWQKEYMSPDTVDRLCRTMKHLGCHAVHIGGGEPLLNWELLQPVLQKLQEQRVAVEYVETNASWLRSHEQAKGILGRLLSLGVNTLLISISPFHSEYVPLQKVKQLIEACHSAGMQVFPWQEQFYTELTARSMDHTHSLEQWEEQFGPGYVRSLIRRFGLILRGRALLYYQSQVPHRSTAQLLAESSGCSELADTGDFHLDLYGSYLPGACSGLAVAVEDLGRPLDPQRYPILTALYNHGVKGLLDVAADVGFRPEPSYASKCHLCMDIRTYLVQDVDWDTRELQPRQYYEQAGAGLNS